MKIAEKHQFIDQLAVRNAMMTCAYCGNEKWMLLIDEPVDLQNQQLLNFTMIARTRAGDVASYPVVSMVCKCCGLLRQHSLAVLFGGDFEQNNAISDAS